MIGFASFQVRLKGLQGPRLEGLRSKGTKFLLLLLRRFLLFEFLVLFRRHAIGNITHCE